MNQSLPAATRATSGRIIRSTTVKVIAVLGLAATGACSTSTDGGASEDVLRIAIPSEPDTLEPCDSNLANTGVVVRSNITQPLMERNATTGELEPLLATEWKTVSDKEIVFTLRDDVKFQNGDSFTAEDAAYSINRAVDPSSECGVGSQMFEGVPVKATAVDETTLKVTAERPEPVLALRLSFVEMVQASDDPTTKNREPIGTGPYAVEDWATGQKLTLARFDDYWGPEPAYESVEYVFRSEGSVRAAMVKAGEADVATSLGVSDGAGDAAVEYANNETLYLGFGAETAPLDDVRVRRAINYAVDRQALIDGLFGGLGQPASQFVNEGIVGFNPDLEPWPYDMEQAKSLVAKAKADGVPVDAPITLAYQADMFPNITEVTAAVGQAMEDAGLKVKIKSVEPANVLGVIPPKPTDPPLIFLNSHGNQGGDLSFTTAVWFGGESSLSFFANKELDRMLAEGERALGDERQERFADAVTYEREHVVGYAFLTYLRGIIALSPDVEYTPNSSTGDEMRLAEFGPAS